MDSFSNADNENKRNAIQLKEKRKKIASHFLAKNKTTGEYDFSNRNLALSYIYNSSLENTFYSGPGRDAAVSLKEDYARYLALTKMIEFFGARVPRLSANPHLGDIKYSNFCENMTLADCIQKQCASPKDNYECSRIIANFYSLQASVTKMDARKPLFLPGSGGSCLGNGAEANLKIAFVLEALAKRGRIIPLSPATRRRLAKSHPLHPRARQWLEKTKQPKGTGHTNSKARLMEDVPEYRLLGLYDCTPDKHGSGKIYIDATLNPYDLATFVLHELNHFAADKFSDLDQVNLLRKMDLNQIDFLEDIGSFTISALSQIDITARQFLERRRNSRASTTLDPFQFWDPLGFSVFTHYITSLKDNGDLSRFSKNLESGGAINAYMEAEQMIRGATASSFNGDLQPNSESRLCQAANQLPLAWMEEMTRRDSATGAPTGPANTNRVASKKQYILHQIADGCHSHVNVIDLKAQQEENLLKFKYTPIIDALNQRWPGHPTDADEIEQLRRQIDSDIGHIVSKTSPACQYTIYKSGVDGAKPGVDGSKSGVDGGKPGVDGAKAGVDGAKSKAALDIKEAP